MTTQQPEALKLAGNLEALHGHKLSAKAATELRRLHEVEKQRDELLEALKAQLAVTDWHEQEGANELARAAIAKAERTTT